MTWFRGRYLHKLQVRIFLTSFVRREAVGLNGPGVEMDRMAAGEGTAGGDTAEAVAARTSSPEGTIWDVEKSGIV